MRYFVRTDGGRDASESPHLTLFVDGTGYALSTAGGGVGWTTAQGVPPFVVGETYNIQIGYTTPAGSFAWSNTQVHSEPPSPPSTPLSPRPCERRTGPSPPWR